MTNSCNEEDNYLKSLFNSCDKNNDGRLDKSDLVSLCQKLKIQDLSDEIIYSLEGNSKGKTVSFEDFIKLKARILPEKVSFNGDDYHNYYSQAQYDDVRDSCIDVSQVYTSVDYDSGAHGNHEQPLSIFAMLHQCYPDLYNQWIASKSCGSNALTQQLLQCANHIHLARINRLYNELKLSVKKINNANTSRDVCQKEVSRLEKEKDRLKGEMQDQAARFEDRITELHGIIGELQKKIKEKMVGEEEEENYEKLDHDKPLMFNRQRNPVMARETLQRVDVDPKIELTQNLQRKDSVTSGSLERQLQSMHSTNIHLQEKLSAYETVVGTLRIQLESVISERDVLRRQLRDLQECVELNSNPNMTCPQLSSSCSISKVSLDSRSSNGSFSMPARPAMGVRQQSKQMQTKTQEPDWVSRIISGYNNGAIGTIHESGQLFLQQLAENLPHPTLSEPCMRLSLEWQRMVATADRESSDRLLLEGTLTEVKAIADQLQCAVSQLQSDCTALASADVYADQIIELMDVLTQLQETENRDNSPVVGGRREHIESVMKHLIYRIEGCGSFGRHTPDSGAGVSSTLSSGVCSVENEGSMRQNDWNEVDEGRLRRILDQLTTDRSRARLSVVGNYLYEQWPNIANEAADVNLWSHFSADKDHEQFVESAILLQEVGILKEERATLKTCVYLLEKEIKSLQLGLESKAVVENSLRLQLTQTMQYRSDSGPKTTSEETHRLKCQINDLMRVLEELRERCRQQQQQNEEFVDDLKKANAALITAFEKAKKQYQNRIAILEQHAALSSAPPASDETAL